MKKTAKKYKFFYAECPVCGWETGDRVCYGMPEYAQVNIKMRFLYLNENRQNIINLSKSANKYNFYAFVHRFMHLKFFILPSTMDCGR